LTLRRLKGAIALLEVTFAGYLNHPSGSVGAFAKISNRSDLKTFEASFTVGTAGHQGPFKGFWAIGATQALARSHVAQVSAALDTSISVSGMVELLANRIRTIADDPKSGVAIGKQIDFVALDRDPSIPAGGGYLTNTVKPETRLPAMITVGPGRGAVMRDAIMEPVDPATLPLSVPRVHRNADCPCGSRKRYRNCHGKRIRGAARSQRA
jgi:hypothetical protein